jgi:hypothetical protein
MKHEVLKWLSGCYFAVKISWNHVKLAVLCGLCIRNQASIKMFEFSSGNLRDLDEVSLLRTCVYRFDKILLMRIIHGINKGNDNQQYMIWVIYIYIL